VKKSFTIFTLVKFSTLFLFSYFLVTLLVPGKVQAWTQQDCINIAMSCATRCANSLTVNNINTVGEACAQNCANEVLAYCKDPNNPQPQVQQPQEEQPQNPQEQLPTAVPQESLSIPAEKSQPFSHDYSGELTGLLGPDSSGCPCSFNLDTMGGFPPMGLILGPDGVLRGTPDRERQ